MHRASRPPPVSFFKSQENRGGLAHTKRRGIHTQGTCLQQRLPSPAPAFTPPSLPPPIKMAHMEGFLLKKSYISYRSRFFQLDGSNLLYKASKEDVKERNLMTLTGDSQVIEFKAKRGK